MEQTDLTKRRWLAAAAGFGALAATGCMSGAEAAPSTEEDSEALSGADIGWVDAIGTAGEPLDLRTLPAGAHSTVIVYGYYVAGDGGGGVFRWTGDTSAVDDGGLVIVPAARPRTGCWKRVVAGPLDVRWFGARGDGVVPDHDAIQRAIDACQARGGGVVLVSPGRYRTGAPLRISAPDVVLQGSGNASVIAPVGGFDTVVVKAATEQCPPGRPPWIYGVRVNDLRFDESAKSGGRLLYGRFVANFVAERLYGALGWNGLEFDAFNNVTLNHPRIEGYRGGGGAAYVRLVGGGPGCAPTADNPHPTRSDVARITQAVFGGARSLGMKGLDIDGFVHTVNLANVHFINIGAEALLTRNSFGAYLSPTFITAVDLENDYPTLECIRLDAGEQFTFIGSLLNGSQERANVYVGVQCRSADFTGGFSTGAYESGIAIAGSDVTVSSMRFKYNAVDAGAPHRYPGILIGGTSRGVTVTGCRSGDPDRFQRHGCQIDVGADEFAVVGNVFTSNFAGGIINGAGAGPARVIANNVG